MAFLINIENGYLTVGDDHNSLAFELVRDYELDSAIATDCGKHYYDATLLEPYLK